MTDQTPPDDGRTPAEEREPGAAPDPGKIELQDELDSIRATGEDLRG